MTNHQPLLFHTGVVSVFAILLPFLVPSEVLATEILIFALAAIGCNLLLGYTGLLSFGQALFFGAGAYFAGLMSIYLPFGLVTVLLISTVAGAAIAIVVGFFSIRRAGIYFVMLTLAFGQLGYYLAFLAEPLTGGEDGLLEVVRPPLIIPFIAEFDFSTNASFYWVTSVAFILAFTLLQRVVDSPLGSVLRAIKQNAARAEAIGYQVRLYKIAVFAFSGAVTALAGSLYALMLNFAPLSNIDIEMSEIILFMCVLGGLGSLYGSILGALIFLLASDLLAGIWPRWMLLLGLMLVVVMLYMPGGMWKPLTTLLNRFDPTRSSDRKGDKNV